MRNKIIAVTALGFILIGAWYILQKDSPSEVTRHESVASAGSHPAVGYGRPVRVARVIDGDTIELDDRTHLRYIGIDTPEEVNPRKPVQCFAKEAAERNKALVENKDIIFYKDISDHDRYGRLLGFVYLPDGTFINNMLVSEGYAFSYRYAPDISKAKEFQRAEDFARHLGLGLWSACRVSKLPNGREETNAIHRN